LEVVQRTASIILGALSPRDEADPVVPAVPAAAMQNAAEQVQEVQQ